MMEVEAKLKEKEGERGKFSLEIKAHSEEIETLLVIKTISLDSVTDAMNRFLRNLRPPPP